MEPFVLIMIPGVLGGILVALLMVRFSRRGGRVSAEGRLAPPSTDMINMSSIRVSGIGGLGMVAMAVTIAIFVPRIRLTMAIALLLGGALAAGLIAFRRRVGPLPPAHPGARAMLPIDAEKAGDADARPRERSRRGFSAVAARP
ncbi:MAG TPA: hypothetical protein VD833_19605 [Vicinamibacterales bacterium]|nr:hypothetical protein [Vicinamibacterales bacterium]